MSRRVVDIRSRAPGSDAASGAVEKPAESVPRTRQGGGRARRRARVTAAAASAAGAMERGPLGRAAERPEASAAAAGGNAAASRAGERRDLFGERLLALEREIEDAIARAGGAAESAVIKLARESAGELLGFYSDLGRAFVAGGVEEVFVRLRMIGTSEAVDDFGYDPAFHARLTPALRFLYDGWWRIELSGVENVPTTGRLLLVGNHSGGFLPYDGFMIAQALREHHPAGGREVRPLIEDFIYHFPFLGPWLVRAGAVRASQENGERLLTREQAIVVFPEGAKGLGKYYRERYRLQRFARGGFVTLAMRTAAPLVPVAVIGGEEIHPVIAKWQSLARLLNLPYFPVTPTFPWLGALGLVPLPTKWRLIFGSPIDIAAEHGPGAHEDDLLVNRVTEQVRERIQRMVIEGLRGRDSVFAG